MDEQWELNVFGTLFSMDYKTDQEFRENIHVRYRDSPVRSLQDYPEYQTELRARTQVLLDYIAQRPAGKQLHRFCPEVVEPWVHEVVAPHASNRNPLKVLTLVRFTRVGSNDPYDAELEEYHRSLQDWVDLLDRQDLFEMYREQWAPSRVGAVRHEQRMQNFATSVRRLREWTQEFLASERELATFLEDAKIQILRYCQPYYMALQSREMKAVMRSRGSNPGSVAMEEE